MTELMHHTGTVDTFVHTTDLTNINTIYSRHTNATDFIDLYISPDGSVTFVLLDTIELTTPTSTITESAWNYLSITWEWDGTRTNFSLQVDDDAAVTLSGNADIVVEDSKSNLAYLAIAYDIENAVQTVNTNKKFIGFISEFNISNFVVDRNIRFSTSCGSYGGCGICP